MDAYIFQNAGPEYELAFSLTILRFNQLFHSPTDPKTVWLNNQSELRQLIRVAQGIWSLMTHYSHHQNCRMGSTLTRITFSNMFGLHSPVTKLDQPNCFMCDSGGRKWPCLDAAVCTNILGQPGLTTILSPHHFNHTLTHLVATTITETTVNNLQKPNASTSTWTMLSSLLPNMHISDYSWMVRHNGIG